MTACTPSNGYPADWPAISRRIRTRAEGRCECPGGKAGCGLHRDRRCEERNGEPAKWARGTVVLTVAHHPDPEPGNVSDGNLLALCQRCHLRVDVDLHARNARRTRIRKAREALASAGQLGLPLGAPSSEG